MLHRNEDNLHRPDRTPLILITPGSTDPTPSGSVAVPHGAAPIGQGSASPVSGLTSDDEDDGDQVKNEVFLGSFINLHCILHYFQGQSFVLIEAASKGIALITSDTIKTVWRRLGESLADATSAPPNS